MTASPAEVATDTAEARSAATRVEVALPGRPYDILIGRGVLAAAGGEIARRFPGARTTVVTDETVAPLHGDALTDSLAAAGVDSGRIVVPAGEGSKRFERLEAVVDGLLAARRERGDLVLALGGGVVGDLAGFAAAITLRGMRVVQLPTTLLAQVDSSVGGKTGINTPRGKNLVGAFHQPSLVLADTGVLDTLPRRELAAGYAEVVKYGLIDDAPFFSWLEARGGEVLARGPALAEAVAHSCRAKARVVLADERETTGTRALLNLGHTFGHALEASTGYGERLIHGEAVAIGMALAFRFSAALGLAPATDAERVSAHLAAVGLPTRLADIPGTLASDAELVALMGQDKKVERGRLTFILARGIGRSFVARDIEASAVERFLAGERSR